jgi:hypothetical protein
VPREAVAELLLELIEGASAPRTEQDHLAVQTDKSPEPAILEAPKPPPAAERRIRKATGPEARMTAKGCDRRGQRQARTNREGHPACHSRLIAEQLVHLVCPAKPSPSSCSS